MYHRNTKSLLFGLPIIALLGGCEGGIVGTGGGPQPGDSHQNVYLPSKVGFRLPNSLLEVPDYEEEDAHSTQSVGNLSGGQMKMASGEVALTSTIGLDISFMKNFNHDTSAKLMLLDAVFKEIFDACAGYDIGEVCKIPDGQISATYTRQMANANYDYWKSVVETTSRYPTQELLEERLRALRNKMDQGIGKVFPLTELEYTQLDGQPYAHRLSLRLETGENSDGTIPGSFWSASGSLGETMIVQWSADKKKLHKSGTHILNEGLVVDKSKDAYWAINTQFTYQDRDDGDIMSLRNESWFSHAPAAFVQPGSESQVTLKQQGDELNRVILRGRRSGRIFEGQANDNGGYYFSRSTDSQTPDTDIYRREVFDGETQLLGAEICYDEGQAGLCHDAGDWQKNPEYNLTFNVTDSPYYLEDGVTEYWGLDPLNVSLAGVPATVGSLVIVNDTAVPPFGAEGELPFLEAGVLCRARGNDRTSAVQAMCWTQVLELHSAMVYEEKQGNIRGVNNYVLLTNVTITINGE